MPSVVKTLTNKGGAQFDFLFTSMYTVSGRRYYVSVKEDVFQSHSFFLKETNPRTWTLEDPAELPQWIQEMEEKLSTVVNTLSHT